MYISYEVMLGWKNDEKCGRARKSARSFLLSTKKKKKERPNQTAGGGFAYLATFCSLHARCIPRHVTTACALDCKTKKSNKKLVGFSPHPLHAPTLIPPKLDTRMYSDTVAGDATCFPHLLGFIEKLLVSAFGTIHD
jgi:hypothetical protein